MGGMAFPSASEPNPVAQGLRGPGPETINMPQPPATTAPATPTTPATPQGPSPYTGSELFYGGNPGEYYSLQGGQATYVGDPNALVGASGNTVTQPSLEELLYYGYTNPSQVPILPGIGGGGSFTNNSLYSNLNYPSGYDSSNSLPNSFSYNSSNNVFQNYNPLYNPLNVQPTAQSGTYGLPAYGGQFLNQNMIQPLQLSGNSVTNQSTGANLGTLSPYKAPGS
jgi:hypothetical protein